MTIYISFPQLKFSQYPDKMLASELALGLNVITIITTV
jgi:hypothetical protein